MNYKEFEKILEEKLKILIIETEKDDTKEGTD